MSSRTVFLGTSDFAATVLRRLAASPHRPALVVAPPDRRRGRGRRLAPPPAAETALEAGLELLQAENVNEPEAIERIAAATPDAAVICAFGQLIREPLLSRLEFLNVHPSLLPRWRGAAPIERSIMAGDPETGVTIMRLAEGLDSGPIGLQEMVRIEVGETYGELAPRLAELGGEMMVRALELRAGGELDWTEQEDSEATYADKIAAAERRLDPMRPAGELERVVRALTPHIGAYLELGPDSRLGVRGAEALEGALEPGAFAGDSDELVLGTADGVLRLSTVQPAGGKPMPGAAYLRGHGPPERAIA